MDVAHLSPQNVKFNWSAKENYIGLLPSPLYMNYVMWPTSSCLMTESISLSLSAGPIWFGAEVSWQKILYIASSKQYINALVLYL